MVEQMANYHPREPHWYLPLMGVDPTCQGKGLGSALMRHALVVAIVRGSWRISSCPTPRTSRSMNGKDLNGSAPFRPARGRRFIRWCAPRDNKILERPART